ncbi:hypothetical protein ADK67_07065 [Saccharothrix sp. NRRL B-16348]|nr:hypothetical protein ADK67_07065 [Saccharothrix sp. NRRL B-16348]
MTPSSFTPRAEPVESPGSRVTAPVTSHRTGYVTSCSADSASPTTTPSSLMSWAALRRPGVASSVIAPDAFQSRAWSHPLGRVE